MVTKEFRRDCDWNSHSRPTNKICVFNDSQLKTFNNMMNVMFFSEDISSSSVSLEIKFKWWQEWKLYLASVAWTFPHWDISGSFYCWLTNFLAALANSNFKIGYHIFSTQCATCCLIRLVQIHCEGYSNLSFLILYLNFLFSCPSSTTIID